MKILHTADIHLDWRFAGIQDTSSRRLRHQEHRDVFREIVDLAIMEEVDAVLIVGDLFEQSSFSLDTIRFTQNQLARLALQAQTGSSIEQLKDEFGEGE